MNNVECESCVKRKTMYCPNSVECYETENKPYWQNRIMLLEENQQLHNKRKKAIELIKNKTKIIPLEDGGGLELCDYDIQNLLEILKDSDVDE